MKRIALCAAALVMLGSCESHRASLEPPPTPPAIALADCIRSGDVDCQIVHALAATGRVFSASQQVTLLSGLGLAASLGATGHDATAVFERAVLVSHTVEDLTDRVDALIVLARHRHLAGQTRAARRHLTDAATLALDGLAALAQADQTWCLTVSMLASSLTDITELQLALDAHSDAARTAAAFRQFVAHAGPDLDIDVAVLLARAEALVVKNGAEPEMKTVFGFDSPEPNASQEEIAHALALQAFAVTQLRADGRTAEAERAFAAYRDTVPRLDASRALESPIASHVAGAILAWLIHNTGLLPQTPTSAIDQEKPLAACLLDPTEACLKQHLMSAATATGAAGDLFGARLVAGELARLGEAGHGAFAETTLAAMQEAAKTVEDGATLARDWHRAMTMGALRNDAAEDVETHFDRFIALVLDVWPREDETDILDDALSLTELLMTEGYGDLAHGGLTRLLSAHAGAGKGLHSLIDGVVLANFFGPQGRVDDAARFLDAVTADMRAIEGVDGFSLNLIIGDAWHRLGQAAPARNAYARAAERLTSLSDPDDATEFCAGLVLKVLELELPGFAEANRRADARHHYVHGRYYSVLISPLTLPDLPQD